jgi:eukaryotic-like serine/threonine-protein kinase
MSGAPAPADAGAAASVEPEPVEQLSAPTSGPPDTLPASSPDRARGSAAVPGNTAIMIVTSEDEPPVRSGPSRRWMVVAAVVIAVLAAGVLVIYSARGGSQDENASPRTSVAASSSPGGKAGARVSAAPSATASPRAGGSVRNDEFVLPDGFYYYTDPTYGWKIAVPNGWLANRDPGYSSMVYFNEPTAPGRRLGVDRTSTPKPDPVADWTDLERRRTASGDLRGYQRVRIEAVPYFQAAADWVYTYESRSGRLQVANRGFVVNDHLAHAIFWLTPQEQWAESESTLRVIFASFRPGR